VHTPGRPPEELSRLDLKNWTPTPPAVEAALIASLRALAPQLDALDGDGPGRNAPGTGVINAAACWPRMAALRPGPSPASSSWPTAGTAWAAFPPLIFKMNASEFAPAHPTGPTFQCHLFGDIAGGADGAGLGATGIAVFITLAERGIIGAAPGEAAVHVPALPVRGPIDIVGAGDTVTATLTLALAAGAELREAMELAQAAASIVVHQLGTTGVATPAELRQILCP
jgi:hypothetical protein